MSKKTEAQRLAAVLPLFSGATCHQAAAELLRQEALIAELAGALDHALMLATSWAANYQFDHQLKDFHPMHAETITSARAALAKVKQ